MKYVVCVPYVWQPYFDEFIATVKIPHENMLLIDNTDLSTNIGIMRAHNQGIDFMNERGADWLIVMSASLRFGEKGGMDFIELLEKHPEYLVINGAGKWLSDPEQRIMALGWHLTAFRREVFEAVGRWDENFSNYGFDDVDLTMRIQKHFREEYRAQTFVCDLSHASTSHSIQLAGVEAPSTPRIMYFQRKWGKHPGEWQVEGYRSPFSDSTKTLSYWPQPDDPLSIQNNEFIKLGGDVNPS
jgi:hypothetical protein